MKSRYWLSICAVGALIIGFEIGGCSSDSGLSNPDGGGGGATAGTTGGQAGETGSTGGSTGSGGTTATTKTTAAQTFTGTVTSGQRAVRPEWSWRRGHVVHEYWAEDEQPSGDVIVPDLEDVVIALSLVRRREAVAS